MMSHYAIPCYAVTINYIKKTPFKNYTYFYTDYLFFILVLSVASFLDNQSHKSDTKAPQTFPSNITDQLTTPEQENW